MTVAIIATSSSTHPGLLTITLQNAHLGSRSEDAWQGAGRKPPQVAFGHILAKQEKSPAEPVRPRFG